MTRCDIEQNKESFVFLSLKIDVKKSRKNHPSTFGGKLKVNSDSENEHSLLSQKTICGDKVSSVILFKLGSKRSMKKFANALSCAVIQDVAKYEVLFCFRSLNHVLDPRPSEADVAKK